MLIWEKLDFEKKIGVLDRNKTKRLYGKKSLSFSVKGALKQISIADEQKDNKLMASDYIKGNNKKSRKLYNNNKNNKLLIKRSSLDEKSRKNISL